MLYVIIALHYRAREGINGSVIILAAYRVQSREIGRWHCPWVVGKNVVNIEVAMVTECSVHIRLRVCVCVWWWCIVTPVNCTLSDKVPCSTLYTVVIISTEYS